MMIRNTQNELRGLDRDEVRGLPPVERFLDLLRSLGRDLVHAARSLAKARAFTFVCVVSLGIGMAPVIAVPYGERIFTMPPPGVNPAGLVELILTPLGPREDSDEWSYPDFVDLRDADTGIAMTGWAMQRIETGIETPGGGKTETVTAMFVSANYFRTLGVALARGPGFDAEMDDPLKVEPVVIVGYEFWQNRLSSDPDIVGKTLTVNGVAHVVVGIAPDQFSGHIVSDSDARLFLPLERHPRLLADNSLRINRALDWDLHVHGRLRPGVGIAQANAAVSAVTSRLARQYPATNEYKAGAVAAYDAVGQRRSMVILMESVLLALTGMVLLVVCLNISGMMQVRSAMRERELSIRQAIGASRGRLVQYLLSEAIILAALGAALGAGVLFNIPPVLAWWSGKPMPPQWQEVLRPDLFMITICVGLCLAASLMFGLLPATRFSRPVIISALKDDAGGGRLRVGRVHRLTAALQVAIAVPLLVISAMLVDQVRATATADLGFKSSVLYAAPLKLDARKDESAGFRIRRVRDSLEKASGVSSVTVADGLPLDFQPRFVRVSLQAEENVAPKFVPAHVTRVGDEYLNTMGIPLLRGRGITAEDRVGSERVAVISKPLADRLFPNADAAEVIGKQLTFAVSASTQQVIVDGPSVTIVGVTDDFAGSQMSTERPQLLLPLAQHPVSSVFLIARSAAGEPAKKLTAAFANALRDLDPDFNPATVITGDQLRRRSMLYFLNGSAFTGGIGGVILVLAGLGIYGIVGLMVATRTREIAVRVALGASRRRVLGMILFDVVKLVMPGVAGGLVIALAVIRLVIPSGGPLMFFFPSDGSPAPPASDLESLAYVVGAAIAILAAILASLAPARRAASVQPMVAMRSE